MRSSGAHWDQTLADEDCDLDLAKRIGETLGEEDWRGGGVQEEKEKEKEKQTALIKSSNPHLVVGE